VKGIKLMHHDDPGLRPVEFLRAVMHDRNAPIADRVKAASAPMDIEPNGQPKPSLTFRIEVPQDVINGIQSLCASIQSFADEQQAYFLSLSPAEQKELIDAVATLERCNEQGIDYPLSHIAVKGHA
jgi:hypothetical protein